MALGSHWTRCVCVALDMLGSSRGSVQRKFRLLPFVGLVFGQVLKRVSPAAVCGLSTHNWSIPSVIGGDFFLCPTHKLTPDGETDKRERERDRKREQPQQICVIAECFRQRHRLLPRGIVIGLLWAFNTGTGVTPKLNPCELSCAELRDVIIRCGQRAIWMGQSEGVAFIC